jgi:hypothetical protein
MCSGHTHGGVPNAQVECVMDGEAVLIRVDSELPGGAELVGEVALCAEDVTAALSGLEPGGLALSAPLVRHVP